MRQNRRRRIQNDLIGLVKYERVETVSGACDCERKRMIEKQREG